MGAGCRQLWAADKREVGSSTLPRPIRPEPPPRRHFRDRGVVIFVTSHLHVVRWCSGFESAPGRQSLLHRCRIGPLITRQDRLPALPTTQRAEILERGVLHPGGKLPPETMPAAAGLCRQIGQLLTSPHQLRTTCREIGFAGSDGAGKTHSLITGCDRDGGRSRGRISALWRRLAVRPALRSKRSRVRSPGGPTPDVHRNAHT